MSTDKAKATQQAGEGDLNGSFNAILDVVKARAINNDGDDIIKATEGGGNANNKSEQPNGVGKREKRTEELKQAQNKKGGIANKVNQNGKRESTVEKSPSERANNDDDLELLMDIVQARATGGAENETEDNIVAAYREKGAALEAKMVSAGTTTTEEVPLQERATLTSLTLDEPVQRAAASQPGAYSRTFSQGTSAREPLPFFLVGIHPTAPAPPESAVQNGARLAEATPVEDDPVVHDMEAQPFDLAAAEKKKTEGAAQNRNKLLALACYLLSMVVVVVVVVTILNGEDTAVAGALAPSAVPSEGPSQSPSTAPTDALDLFLQNLPSNTLASLEEVNSPQWKALNWLQAHPNTTGLEEWRKQQLFALATFFYSMGGGNWQKGIQGSWLQYSTDECNWFSSTRGFIAEDGDYVLDSGKDFEDLNLTLPCNSDGRFQSLVLFELDAAGAGVRIPPQVSLLTSLRDLALNRSNINASLPRFLPSTMYAMPNLNYLDLDRNKLHGRIPTELGTVAGLERLAIERNALSGPVPSQFGLLTSLQHLTMERNQLSGYIPTEMGRMTNIQKLNTRRNNLNGTIPVDLFRMTNAAEIYLDTNSLTGSIPSEVGFLTNLENLQLQRNGLVGSLPSQLGMLTGMTNLYLSKNMLSGSIPTQVGLLTNMGDLEIWINALTGSIPSQLGQLTTMRWLAIHSNQLSGPVPSDLGRATDLTTLTLRMNNLSGSLPSELGLLQKVEQLRLENNTLTGTVPSAMGMLALNGSVFSLTLANNNLSGTIPESLCALGLYKDSWKAGLSFDCNDQLCGCCWCPCPGSNYSEECVTIPFIPSRDDSALPGLYPTPINTTNAVTINMKTDDYPEDVTMRWMKLEENGDWSVEDIVHPRNASTLLSYPQEAKSHSIYKLELVDSFSDGTCCGFGFGWFSVTNATTINEGRSGTVLWEAGGYELTQVLEVYFWVDKAGHVQRSEFLKGRGYALFQGNDPLGDPIVVYPDLQ